MNPMNPKITPIETASKRRQEREHAEAHLMEGEARLEDAMANLETLAAANEDNETMRTALACIRMDVEAGLEGLREQLAVVRRALGVG